MQSEVNWMMISLPARVSKRGSELFRRNAWHCRCHEGKSIIIRSGFTASAADVRWKALYEAWRVFGGLVVVVSQFHSLRHGSQNSNRLPRADFTHATTAERFSQFESIEGNKTSAGNVAVGSKNTTTTGNLSCVKTHSLMILCFGISMKAIGWRQADVDALPRLCYWRVPMTARAEFSRDEPSLLPSIGDRRLWPLKVSTKLVSPYLDGSRTAHVDQMTSNWNFEETWLLCLSQTEMFSGIEPCHSVVMWRFETLGRDFYAPDQGLWRLTTCLQWFPFSDGKCSARLHSSA